MIFEISFMFIIILGRWILPKGDISHSALSQLLLVYLSLASDILDLLTLLSEHKIQSSRSMVYVVLSVFSICMLQFALNLTATRGRSFRAEFDQTEIEIHQSAPTHLEIPLIEKPIPRHRKILSKILKRSSSSQTVKQRLPRPKPRSATFTQRHNPPSTIFENSNAIKIHETLANPSKTLGKKAEKSRANYNLDAVCLVDSPRSLDRRFLHQRPSITSLNSFRSSIGNASTLKTPPDRKRSISASVRFFFKNRSMKFLRSEIWSILVTLAIQDGPFFAVRLVAIIVYHAGSFLLYFFTFKNFLILVFQTYRVAAICLEKDEHEREFEEKVNTMRRMSIAATQLGIPLNRKI